MPPRYIYLASSWRNPLQPFLVELLREAGLEVYDFRNPAPGENGFSWRDVGGNPAAPDERGAPLPKGADLVASELYLEMIEHPVALEGFGRDFDAMKRADVFVLALPCGRSAHLELGWAIGAGKKTAILLEEPTEPELMYRLADHLSRDVVDLLRWLEVDVDELVADHVSGILFDSLESYDPDCLLCNVATELKLWQNYGFDPESEGAEC